MGVHTRGEAPSSRPIVPADMQGSQKPRLRERYPIVVGESLDENFDRESGEAQPAHTMMVEVKSYLSRVLAPVGGFRVSP